LRSKILPLETVGFQGGLVGRLLVAKFKSKARALPGLLVGDQMIV